MNPKLRKLIDEGRQTLRQMEEIEAQRIADEKQREKEKIDSWMHALSMAVCGKLPEELWPYINMPTYQDWIPYENYAVLKIGELIPITLHVRYNSHAWIEGKWINVPGIEYYPPKFDDENQIYEGQISMAPSVDRNASRLIAFPLNTDDIALALAVAEQRAQQLANLDNLRLAEIERLKSEQQRLQQQSAAEERQVFQSAEQLDGILIEAKIGQINPLIVMESWIREIARDEITRNWAN